MKLQLNQIALAVNGKLLGDDGNVIGISIDTRTLQNGNLYVAIKGKNFDGHDFAEQAKQAGAVAVMCEHALPVNLPQVIVNDSRLALAELAGYWRRLLPVKVVGITGSNGKTTVKEMVAAILATQGETLSTQGNLNNEIGAPLTLLKLTDVHRYAVIEMGANHPQEIAYIAKYVQADVSVITNAGPAHVEGFGSIDGVARAKAEIIEQLNDNGIAILNRDDAFFDFWRNLAGKRQVVSFGLHADADVSAKNISLEMDQTHFSTRFELQMKTEHMPIKLKLLGKHNVINALAAAAAATQMGLDLTNVKAGLECMRPVTGRMQPLLGRKGNWVIDDTYNANPASLFAGLSSLSDQHENWLVLGAFAELGEDSLALHQQMGILLNSMPVQRLFAQGEGAEHTVAAFNGDGRFFQNQEQLITALQQALTGRETLLIKGSRSQRMENVVAALVDNFRAA